MDVPGHWMVEKALRWTLDVTFALDLVPLSTTSLHQAQAQKGPVGSTDYLDTILGRLPR